MRHRHILVLKVNQEGIQMRIQMMYCEEAEIWGLLLLLQVCQPKC